MAERMTAGVTREREERRVSEPNPVEPQHYKSLDPEPIVVIEAWGLGFHLGNAVKYIARASKKGDELTDLRKARWYLQRAIDRLESEHAAPAGTSGKPDDP